MGKEQSGCSRGLWAVVRGRDVHRPASPRFPPRALGPGRFLKVLKVQGGGGGGQSGEG